jgi:hypothetical protein
MEPKDSHNETVSVRQPKSSKPSPPAAAESGQPGGASSPAPKPPRQTASANPVSPDDLLAEPAMDWDNSWIPLVSAFAVGLVVGLIAGILAARD